MARITPSALIDDVKGSIGGVTFSSWKGMSYVKAKAKSVRNPATGAQVEIRNAMTFFSRRFFDDLTDAQRGAWDQYAQEIAGAARAEQVQGGFGSRVVPQRSFNCSGYNWFIRLNVRLVKELGTAHYAAPIDDAPIGQTPPSQPVLDAVGFEAGVGRFAYNFTGPQDLGHAVNLKVALWVLPNWGYAREQAVHDVATPGQVFTGQVLDELLIQRATLTQPLPDGLYAFQMDAVGVENGLVSPPSEVIKASAKFVAP